MEIKTFRAKTMQQALNLVRENLGPEATVLHTRELNANLLGRMFGRKEFEIAASNQVHVPAKVAIEAEQVPESSTYSHVASQSYFEEGISELHHNLDTGHSQGHDDSEYLSEELFEVYADLIEADVEEQICQEYIERLRREHFSGTATAEDYRGQLMEYLESELHTSGPLLTSNGQGRVVALVGPTGVGKTTTIAKLAANYRLRENKRVGLITVDTYRIAAVEQLRTYAEIIDLPMEVVSTPKEMREAVAKLSNLDLVLMDTAGRSPRDDVRIQELKSMLAEAKPAEVHLVLSAVGGARSLATTAERFATVNTTSMIVTKLDEATALGNLVSVSRSCGLPISYVTDGQNVPDDIQTAQSRELAKLILQQH